MKTGIIQNSNIKKILITLTSNSRRIEFASIIVNDVTTSNNSVIYSQSFIVDPMESVYTEIPISSIDYNDSPDIEALEVEYITSSDLLEVKIDYAYY